MYYSLCSSHIRGWPLQWKMNTWIKLKSANDKSAFGPPGFPWGELHSQMRAVGFNLPPQGGAHTHTSQQSDMIRTNQEKHRLPFPWLTGTKVSTRKGEEREEKKKMRVGEERKIWQERKREDGRRGERLPSGQLGGSGTKGAEGPAIV